MILAMTELRLYSMIFWVRDRAGRLRYGLKMYRTLRLDYFGQNLSPYHYEDQIPGHIDDWSSK